MWWIIGIIAWLACGIFTWGYCFAYYMGRFPLIAKEMRKSHLFFSICMAFLAPISTFLIFIINLPDKEGRQWYGWRLW